MMNKNLYRVIFNKARGLLMVVAEITRAHSSQGNSAKGVTKHASAPLTATLTPVAFLTCIGLGVISVAQASVIVDKNAPAEHQSGLSKTQSGHDLINITAPTAGGVSINEFTELNTSADGTYFNNSTRDTWSRETGRASANALLNGKSATVIVGQVNSDDPTILSGNLSILGQQAHLIISNTNGITCNGCGVINANKTTLTTGQVLLEEGNLAGYQVTKDGTITIKGDGLNSENYTELIARSVAVNSTIQAKEIKVVAGTNKVSGDLSKIEAQSSESRQKPTVAIDVSQLGGMHAERIQLIGTEEGVGVNNEGWIGAWAGDVTISANGVIDNQGSVYARKDINIDSASDINNQNSLEAHGNLQLTSAGNITMGDRALMMAGKDLHLKAEGDINTHRVTALNNSTIDAGGAYRSNGITDIYGDLDIKANDIEFNDLFIAKGSSNIEARNNIVNNDLLSFSGDLNMVAEGNITNNDLYVGSLGSTN
ncbi:MAG: ESPR-type extended signal peptide-containing protein [Enterobacteriaceae bacterium]